MADESTPEDPNVAEGKAVQLSDGQRRLFDEALRSYRVCAEKQARPDLLLTPEQEEWLRSALACSLPVLGSWPEDPVRRMDLTEFVEKGFLFEINRRFLHPMGLALEVVEHFMEDGGPRMISLGGVWDYRSDPEGMRYGEPPEDPIWITRRQKAAAVQAAEQERHPTREAALGFVVQPIPPE